MWWHIKSKESIFMYSNYCRNSLLCTKYCMYCMFVCVLWIVNVNHYGAMLKTKANRLVTKTHKMSPFCPNWSSNTICSIFLSQRVPTLISSRDPTVVCHMVLITFHCPRNETSVFRCAYRRRCARDSFIQCNCHQTTQISDSLLD